MKYTLTIITAALSAANAAAERINELVVMPGHDKLENKISPEPHTYLSAKDLPKEFNWNAVTNKDHSLNGKSCISHSLNQHIPQYCGSCWAHAAVSSIADRIKIQRECIGDDINLSVQYILSCGGNVAGSCHGGSSTGVYQFMSEHEVPFDTCMPYIACSSESEEGFCKHVDTTCTAINTARTCGTFTDKGGDCEALPNFPNVTVAEWGTIVDEDPIKRVEKIKAEVFARGPVSATINALPLKDFMGGKPFDEEHEGGPDHVVSIIGWGVEDDKEHWIIRNSWGAYWGEGGFFRVVTGKNLLQVEGGVSWGTPKHWTEKNVPCSEDGHECGGVVNNHGGKKVMTFIGREYVDPSVEYLAATKSNLRQQTVAEE